MYGNVLLYKVSSIEGYYCWGHQPSEGLGCLVYLVNHLPIRHRYSNLHNLCPKRPNVICL